MGDRKSGLLKHTGMEPCHRSEEIVRTIRQATLHKDAKMLLIDWDDEFHILSTDKFPFIWLRDNCQCSECFDIGSSSRTVIFEDLNFDTHPLNVTVKDRTVVEIIWTDNHISHFTAQYLQQRVFKLSLKRKSLLKLDRVLWGASFKKNIPRADFQEIISNDEALFKWLQQLDVYGVVFIDKVPCAAGQVQLLAKKVGFVKESHLGSHFIVKAKPHPTQIAYSTGPIQLHTDMPHLEYKPGIMLLHCLIQNKGNGGESQIVDAFKVALQLRDECPDMYKILTEIPVTWVDKGNVDGKEYHKVLERPVISLDSKGCISRIDFSHHHRDSFFDVEAELVAKWYEAMKFFSYLLYHPRNCIEFKMTPGTILSFDNQRLLHGRSSYKGGKKDRILQACFLDWDEARSKRRVLEDKLNYTSEHLVS